MNFDKLIREIEADEEVHARFSEIETETIEARLKKLETLKLYVSEFLDIKDVEKINKEKRFKKNISYKDQRIEVRVNALGDCLCLSRKDSYRDQDEPFFKVGVSAIKSQISFAMYQHKATHFEESCYVFSYNGSKLIRAEVFECGEREIIDYNQQTTTEAE